MRSRHRPERRADPPPAEAEKPKSPHDEYILSTHAERRGAARIRSSLHRRHLMQIRTKLALGLILILIINLAAGLYGFHLLTDAAERRSIVRETSSSIVTTALLAQVHFKKQVQEWKNVLLRGADPALFDDYFTRFEQEEARTRASVAELIRIQTGTGHSHAISSRFLEAHHQLGEAYRAALARYRPEDPRTQRAVDDQVRHIDRAPADLIDQIVTTAWEDKLAILAEIDASTHHLHRQILLLMAGIMSSAVLLVVWWIDRTIGQPIAMATVVARRVSTGDFSTPVKVSGNDEPWQMLAALRTMQESLSRFQESLRQSEARFRLLLDSTDEGIFGVDTDGICTFCNPAGARMLGYASAHELHGRHMHDTVHHAREDGSPIPPEQCRATAAYREGRSVRVDDEVFWRADGRPFPVEYHANPIHQNSRLVGAVITFSDITARKEAASALQAAHAALAAERAQLAERVLQRTLELDRANAELGRSARAKDEFLAAMSHELRTPLTSILGLSETMGDALLGRLSPQQERAIHMIHENGVHLLALINDILDMSRVASGQMQMHWDQVPVFQLCDASLRLTAPAAKRKGLTVTKTIDPAARLVRGDSRRLKQMLVNLLDNAVKFTPEGGTVGLEVTAHAATGQLHLRIWDTGIGIPPDQLERLFQPFVQLDSRPTRQHDGTGLGLALAAGMADLHQGRIEVHSEVGRGSSFRIVLPWDPQAQNAEQIRDTPDIAQAPAGGRKTARRPRVLLADDHESTLEMLSTYLRIRGCAVMAARNGLEAIAHARAHPPDVILMDVQMPELDGLDTTRRLRADPVLRHTPIIALTALAMPGDRERCLEAGMDDYLSKPLGLKELYGTIMQWVERARARV